ncbi:hypothetical protein EMGBS15_11850 [Filimonas sp.]|nr:hypothetical protein EMGBS15_11850 [Filimonas sp.]
MKANKQILIHILIGIGFLLIPFLFLAGEMASFNMGFHNPYDTFTIVGYLFFVVLLYSLLFTYSRLLFYQTLCTVSGLGYLSFFGVDDLLLSS